MPTADTSDHTNLSFMYLGEAWGHGWARALLSPWSPGYLSTGSATKNAFERSAAGRVLHSHMHVRKLRAGLLTVWWKPGAAFVSAARGKHLQRAAALACLLLTGLAWHACAAQGARTRMDAAAWERAWSGRCPPSAEPAHGA